MDAKGFYKLENGYRRKLVIKTCSLCGTSKLSRPSRVDSVCRKCAYQINAKRINSYIKRPGRDEKGRYTKTT